VARVYRNLSRPVLVFGLELPELATSLAIFAVVANFSDWLWADLLVLGGGLIALRSWKRGKPPGYAADLVRFLLSTGEFVPAEPAHSEECCP